RWSLLECPAGFSTEEFSYRSSPIPRHQMRTERTTRSVRRFPLVTRLRIQSLTAMPSPTIAPYGSWKSPITSDLIVAETIRLGGVFIEGADIYWLEMRPREGGRSVLVGRTAEGGITDITPAPFNARTRVHEYGGGSVLLANATVWFSNFADQFLYR